jgi:predicted secreted protein
MSKDWRNQEIEKSMRPGDLFYVTFEEAASAGYLWTAESADGLDVSKKTVPQVRSGIGSFNEVSFMATMEKPGNYEITFTHKRPWEDEADRTVRYVLSVKP